MTRMSHLEGTVRAIAAAPGFAGVVSGGFEPGLTKGGEDAYCEGTLLLVPKDDHRAVTPGDANHLVQDSQRESE